MEKPRVPQGAQRGDRGDMSRAPRATGAARPADAVTHPLSMSPRRGNVHSFFGDLPRPQGPDAVTPLGGPRSG